MIEVHRLLAVGSQQGFGHRSFDRLGRLPVGGALQRSVGSGSGPGEACVTAESARHVLLAAEREFPTPTGHALLLDFTGVERLGHDAACEFANARPPGFVTAINMSPAVKTVWERTWREVLSA